MQSSVKLAKFDELWHAWPRVGKKELANALQGSVSSVLEQVEEDGPIRLSAAFNRTGHPMPTSSMWSGAQTADRDGFLYMTETEDMKKFFTQKFGKPRHLKNEFDAVGLRGIILFEGVHSKGFNGSHFDLWNEKETCDVRGDYFTQASNILLWELAH